jgi:hypothetical protein
MVRLALYHSRLCKAASCIPLKVAQLCRRVAELDASPSRKKVVLASKLDQTLHAVVEVGVIHFVTKSRQATLDLDGSQQAIQLKGDRTDKMTS